MIAPRLEWYDKGKTKVQGPLEVRAKKTPKTWG